MLFIDGPRYGILKNIISTISRFWEADNSMKGETCLSQQADGSCKSIAIPSCVDRTVYCSKLPAPKNSTIINLNGTNPKNLPQLGTSVRFTCPSKNWYFNYSIPGNLMSFYYSTNINNMTLTCNIYG
jgi:hypothetical protein